MLLAQLDEQPSALNAGERAVVTGQDYLRPRLPRFGQQFAGDTAVQHRRRVHHHDSALVPIRRPFFSQRAACTVAASLNPSAFRSCAPTFVGAKPITRRSARSMSNHWPLSTDHAGALKALRPESGSPRSSRAAQGDLPATVRQHECVHRQIRVGKDGLIFIGNLGPSDMPQLPDLFRVFPDLYRGPG